MCILCVCSPFIGRQRKSPKHKPNETCCQPNGGHSTRQKPAETHKGEQATGGMVCVQQSKGARQYSQRASAAYCETNASQITPTGRVAHFAKQRRPTARAARLISQPEAKCKQNDTHSARSPLQRAVEMCSARNAPHQPTRSQMTPTACIAQFKRQRRTTERVVRLTSQQDAKCKPNDTHSARSALHKAKETYNVHSVLDEPTRNQMQAKSHPQCR